MIRKCLKNLNHDSLLCLKSGKVKSLLIYSLTIWKRVNFKIVISAARNVWQVWNYIIGLAETITHFHVWVSLCHNIRV